MNRDMDKRYEEKILHFEGLVGRNSFLQTRARLTEFCKVIGTNNLFINYTELISNVLMVGKPVDPDKLPFMENVKPNTQSLQVLIDLAKGDQEMPGDQKEVTTQLLGSIEYTERRKANPHHYELAACINGLLKAIESEAVEIVDDYALRGSIDSVVDSYRPIEEE